MKKYLVCIIIFTFSLVVFAQIDRGQVDSLGRFPFHENTKIYFICDNVTGNNQWFNYIREAVNRTSKASVVRNEPFSDKMTNINMQFDTVLDKNPTIAVIYVGMSELAYNRNDPDALKTVIEDYEKTVRSMVEKLKDNYVLPLIVTPVLLGEKKHEPNPIDDELNTVAELTVKIGSDYGVPVINLRDIFVNYLAQHKNDERDAGVLTNDGLYFNENGSWLAAAEISRGILQVINNNPGYLLFSLNPSTNNLEFHGRAQIAIFPMDTSFKDTTIRFSTSTTGARTINENSSQYDNPINISRDLIVTAAMFVGQAKIGVDSTRSFIKAEPLSPIETPEGMSLIQNGLIYKLYNELSLNGMPREYIFPEEKFSGSGYTKSLTLNDITNLSENFALDIIGYIEIKDGGIYSFKTTSDDGSVLFIDNKLVVNNDGSHGTQSVEGSVVLAPGFHPIRIMYFQGGGGYTFDVFWKTVEDNDFTIIPEDMLYSESYPEIYYTQKN